MNTTLRRLLAVGVLATLAISCSDDNSAESGDSERTTAASTTSAATTSTVAVTTTVAATTTTAAAATTTTAATGTTSGATTTVVGVTSTTEPCVPPTSTEGVNEDYPDRLSSAYGVDVDTGGHECFERVVFEFAGDGEFPSYDVHYEDEPLVLGSDGQPVTLNGEADLVVFIGAWMGEEGAYFGPMDIEPTNVGNIEEVRLLDNFEGAHIWGIGLDEQRAFEVFKLQDPMRLVIDIAKDAPPA